MPDVDEQPKNEQRSSAAGPGDRLQAARIEQGLSLDDVAGRMHLSANILKAIENNEFEEITAPIFVKGYLRAYARIVSLDEDDMIDQYIDFYSEEDPPITSTGNTASELSAADPRFKWTTYIVVIIIGVALTTWWWNREQNDEPTISLEAQSSRLADSGKSDAEVVSSEIQAVSEDQAVSEELIETDEVDDSTVQSVTVTEVEPVTSTTVQESSAVEIEVVEVEVVEGEIAEGEVVESEVEEVEAAQGLVDTTEVVEVEAADSEVVAATSGSLETEQGTRNAPARIAPVGSDKLKIIVHADTWADIKDAASYQLVYDLLRADRSVELMGQAPFKVFLGNGHGVEILFNGEEIEVAPRIRDDNTARLKIGG